MLLPTLKLQGRPVLAATTCSSVLVSIWKLAKLPGVTAPQALPAAELPPAATSAL
jgi:hypothetical protein